MQEVMLYCDLLVCLIGARFRLSATCSLLLCTFERRRESEVLIDRYRCYCSKSALCFFSHLERMYRQKL